MAINKIRYNELKKALGDKHVELVAVSKIQSTNDINELYLMGQKDFGENYVQEVVEKQLMLPGDIRWHFIGHLQSNKVKLIAPFVYLIHGVDSLKLLKEINKQGAKCGRVINCLLQVHVAKEETKFGLDEEELANIIKEVNQHHQQYAHILIKGIMGMASFSDDEALVRGEFKLLKSLFDQYKHTPGPCCNFSILSMGMSGDYTWAVEEGSTMVRIGSLIFGARL